MKSCSFVRSCGSVFLYVGRNLWIPFSQVPVEKSYRWGESSTSLLQWLFIPNNPPMILMLPLMEEPGSEGSSRGPKSCSQQDHLQSQIGFFMALGVSCQLCSTCGLWAAGGEGKWGSLSCIRWEVSKWNEIIRDPLLAERHIPLAAYETAASHCPSMSSLIWNSHRLQLWEDLAWLKLILGEERG